MKLMLSTPAGAARPTDLPDISAALAWRGWDDGLAEAHQRQRPMIALAEPAWTTSAQRLALVLGRDDALRAQLEDAFVPVLIDPVTRPDLAAWWRWAAISLTGSAGPPLLMLLTPAGLPFLSYGSLWPEGRGQYPSLASLARATHAAFQRNPQDIAAEAERLLALGSGREAPAYASLAEFWRGVSSDVDRHQGGIGEVPKHPHPILLWSLLELAATGEEPEAAGFVRLTLRRLRAGGINDQLGSGFHRCSRDERWIVPHFEKPLPLNAQLAAVYARAARTLDEPEFQAAADELVQFCLSGLEAGVDAVGADTQYYTWTSGEVFRALDPAFVQAVAFYYHVTPDDSRQVLYRALEPEAMDQYSYESPEILRRRVVSGSRQLGRERGRRPAPELVSLPSPAWQAETIRWLVAAAGEGCAVPTATLADNLSRLLPADLTANRPPAATPDNQPTFLADNAALLAAIVAMAQETGAREWIERGRLLADRLLDRAGDDDGWRDGPDRGLPGHRSWAVTDAIIPAPVAALTDALIDLAELAGTSQYRLAARRVAAHLPAAHAAGVYAAGVWRAWFRASTAGPG